MMEKELCYKNYYSYEEVKENGGCIETWVSKEKDIIVVKSESIAWESLSRSLMGKYLHKQGYIKRFTHGTYYDGTRYVKIYEDYGIRVYQYLAQEDIKMLLLRINAICKDGSAVGLLGDYKNVQFNRFNELVYDVCNYYNAYNVVRVRQMKGGN